MKVILACVAITSLCATAAQSGPWRYTSTKDEMRGTVDKEACVTSLTTIHLNPPYHSQKPELCVRSRPGLTQVYVNLRSPGQFTTKDWTHLSVDGSPVIFYKNSTNDVRDALFLEDQAIDTPPEISNARTADGHTDWMTILKWHQSLQNLPEKIEGAHKLIIEVEMYGAGTQQATFDVSGLKWDYHGP